VIFEYVWNLLVYYLIEMQSQEVCLWNCLINQYLCTVSLITIICLKWVDEAYDTVGCHCTVVVVIIVVAYAWYIITTMTFYRKKRTAILTCMTNGRSDGRTDRQIDRCSRVQCIMWYYFFFVLGIHIKQRLRNSIVRA